MQFWQWKKEDNINTRLIKYFIQVVNYYLRPQNEFESQLVH